MHNPNRRTLLKGTLTAGIAAVAAGAGLLTPHTVLAAAWPKAAFDAKGLDKATSALLGSSSASESKDIKVKTPSIAENGAVVNVAVSTSLPNVDSISILVEQNGSPLAASFDLNSRTEPYIKTRVKVAKTSGIVAVVRSGGKLYSARREVKVTLGGCGG